MTSTTYLIFDIGGTWIKATQATDTTISDVLKAPSTLQPGSKANDLVATLIELAEKFSTISPNAIAISTAGVVNYQGTALELCAPHLSALRNPDWITQIRTFFQCPVTLINDADAALIGVIDEGCLLYTSPSPRDA